MKQEPILLYHRTDDPSRQTDGRGAWAEYCDHGQHPNGAAATAFARLARRNSLHRQRHRRLEDDQPRRRNHGRVAVCGGAPRWPASGQ